MSVSTHLSNAGLTYGICDRLGVDIYRRASRCPFCNATQDAKGNHAKGCMSGGDVTLRRNALRDLTGFHARSGPTMVACKPSRILSRPDGPEELSRRRPADILLRNWQEAPLEAPGVTQAALDFAIINALGAAHISTTREMSGAMAAHKYGERKLLYEDTARRCLQEGIVLKPVVFTAQGAADPASLKTLEVLHRGVAGSTGIHLGQVRSEYMIKVSVALLRANARAARRRDPDGKLAAARGQSKLATQARKAMVLTMGLEGPHIA